MKPIDVEGFEQKFRTNIDPWDYTNSHFEKYKRAVLLQACGASKHGRVLELGCAIGQSTRDLSRVSLRLLAVDGSVTALREAKKRLQGERHVRLRRAVLPGMMPRGSFDLIVASEIAYYLPAHQLRELSRRIVAALAPGGRVVLLNHRRHFDDAAQHSALAHQRLRARFATCLQPIASRRFPRFDVATYVRPHLGATVKRPR
jgi:SAM-dependent methyltransferase